MEEWKVIEDYPDYQISSLGRVKSIRRKNEKILACCPNGDGYRHCNIYNGVKGSGRKTVRVAILVAKAFVPNPDNKPEVDHINRDRADDTASNLRWATRSEQAINQKDREHSTDYKNISVRYRVKFVREGKETSKYFLTLEDAIAWRNKNMPE